jgi:hypothetical protein
MLNTPTNCLTGQISLRVHALSAIFVCLTFPSIGYGAKAVEQWTPYLPAWAPNTTDARSVCSYVASKGPAIISELVRSGALNVENNDTLYDASVGVESGSAGGEKLEYRVHGADANAKPLPMKDFDDRPWAYRGFGARWLRYQGHTYTVIFESESLRSPNYLGFIDSYGEQHFLCSFDVDEHEKLRAVNSATTNVCRAVSSHRTSFLPVDTTSASSLKFAAPIREQGEKIIGSTDADVTNSGVPAHVALIEADYGGARGWRSRYLDAIANDQVVSDGRLHKLLMVEQNIKGGGARDFMEPGAFNFNESKLFTYEGLVYVDLTARPPGDKPVHEVQIIHATQIETVCTADFEVTWRVSSMAKQFPH